VRWCNPPRWPEHVSCTWSRCMKTWTRDRCVSSPLFPLALIFDQNASRDFRKDRYKSTLHTSGLWALTELTRKPLHNHAFVYSLGCLGCDMTSFISSCSSFICNFVRSMPPPPDDTMDVDEPPKEGLFAQCTFIVLRSASLPEETAKKVKSSRICCRLSTRLTDGYSLLSR